MGQNHHSRRQSLIEGSAGKPSGRARTGCLLGAASVIALLSLQAQAQTQAQASPRPTGGPINSLEEIVVTGRNVYRNRTADINPTLAYELDFFQRFEPLTVGEMLKRTPGVVFTSDVLEYDAVQLRGLGAEYTEVLINGRPIPGQGADRTFFVDRIPSELVKRIEIIRSPSADMTAEGVAGTLNIILKDGANLEGILARFNSTYYGDGDDKLRHTGALALADAGDGYDYWLGLNVQERRNPKKKVEEYYDDEALEGFAFEDDTRDGTDYSLNGSAGVQLPAGDLRINGFYVFTDRRENEFVREYEGSVVDARTGDLVALETQEEQIDQTSWGFDGHYTLPVRMGELALSGGVARFDEDTFTTETEEEFEDGASEGVEEDVEALEIEDTNYTAEVSYTHILGAFEVKSGLAARRNKREGIQDGEFSVIADLEETRLSPYSKLTWETAGGLSMEGGIRYTLYDREVSSSEGDGSQDGGELLPSLSLRWDATSRDRFTAGLARTLRRPQFDLVAPFEEDEAPDDDDAIIGNPDLDSEIAWGLDLGYERRVREQGMLGLNFFYRDITDVIEITDTGLGYPAGGGGLFTPRNVGDGSSWGLEFDISTPLDFIGLPNTGFYANYAWLDSDITDPFTGEERRFRDQPNYVYNLSLTQDLPSINGGAGISYQKRGASLAAAYGEYVTTEYDGNLELFIEVNLLANTVLRFSGNNLLDSEKLEYMREYGEPIDEIQREQSSQTFTLTLRSSF